MSPSSTPSGKKNTGASKVELIKCHRQISLGHFLTVNNIPRLGFVLGVSMGLPLLWVVSDVLFTVPVATPSGLPIFISLNLLVVTCGALYIDSRLPVAVVKVGDVIENESEYYQLMKEFFLRLYRPGTRILWLFIPSLLVTALILNSVSRATTATDLALVIIIAAVSSIVLSAYAWVTISISIYMGWRLRRFTIHLDVTRSADNLGLQPYSEFVFHALLINMVGYALTAAYVFFLSFNPLLVLFLIAGTGFATFWFVGSQYGLHRAIVNSKHQRLTELRQEYGDEIHGWFALGDPNPTLDEIGAASQFLRVKREIEGLPEWPSNAVQFVRAAGVAASANLVASLPLIL